MNEFDEDEDEEAIARAMDGVAGGTSAPSAQGGRGRRGSDPCRLARQVKKAVG